MIKVVRLMLFAVVAMVGTVSADIQQDAVAARADCELWAGKALDKQDIACDKQVEADTAQQMAIASGGNQALIDDGDDFKDHGDENNQLGDGEYGDALALEGEAHTLLANGQYADAITKFNLARAAYIVAWSNYNSAANAYDLAIDKYEDSMN